MMTTIALCVLAVGYVVVVGVMMMFPQRGPTGPQGPAGPKGDMGYPANTRKLERNIDEIYGRLDYLEAEVFQKQYGDTP